MSKVKQLQTRNKDLFASSNNGGQFASKKLSESTQTLDAPRKIENVSDQMANLGLHTEHDIVQFVFDRCISTIGAQMRRSNVQNKVSDRDFDDLRAEAALQVVIAARNNTLQNASNVMGYVTHLVRNVVRNQTAVTKNANDIRAKNDLDSIIELETQIYGVAPSKEEREVFVRKIRESYGDANGSHKPSVGFAKPPTLTYSIENKQGFADDSLDGSDMVTAALMDRNALYTDRSISSSMQPEMRVMEAYGELDYLLDGDAKEQEEMDDLARLSVEQIEDTTGQMYGVFKRRAMRIFTKQFNLPSTDDVLIPQGKVTQYRKLISTPADVTEVCNAWMHGEIDKKGEAFFSPWGETTEEEKDNLVHFFTKGLSDPANSLKYWEESLTGVNTMQIKRDNGYEATAKSKAKGKKTSSAAASKTKTMTEAGAR